MALADGLLRLVRISYAKVAEFQRRGAIHPRVKWQMGPELWGDGGVTDVAQAGVDPRPFADSRAGRPVIRQDYRALGERAERILGGD